MEYFEKIKFVRNNRNITQKEIADELSVTVRNYQYIESGKQNLNQNQLLVLANKFEVSVDYLLGRTDNPEINK